MSNGIRVREHRDSRTADRPRDAAAAWTPGSGDRTARTMSPCSSTKVADLAETFIDGGWWRPSSSQDVRELISTIRRLEAADPAVDSTKAKSMATAAKRIAELAREDLQGQRVRNPQGRDLSWFTDPVLMDEHERADRT